MSTVHLWTQVAHVDPPPEVEETIDGPGGPDSITFYRSLIFYLGPNHYPAGLYLPQGYDLESRPSEDGWTIIRARDSASHQVLTLWAVNEDREADEQVRILDP